MSQTAQHADGEMLAQLFADKIGIPLDEWYGACHRVSLAIVKAGLLHGPSGARVRVARGWTERVSGQHSWISLGDPYNPQTRYVDPTWWCWTETDRQLIWSGEAEGSGHTPHGAGSIWDYGKPVHQGGETISLTPDTPLSGPARRFLDMLGPLDAKGWMVLGNAPVGGWPAAEVFTAMSQTPLLGEFVPIDVRGMLTEENPGGLYF